MSRSQKIEKFAKIYEALSSDSQHLYLLIVDLCNSTEFKQKIRDMGFSDHHWFGRQICFLQMTSDFIKATKGTIVKTMGDAVMASYDYSESAEQIVHTCVEMTSEFDSLKTFNGLDRIEVKLSLDYGETINGSVSDSGKYDPIGSCVDRCARLNSLAKSHELIFSSEFDKKLNLRDKTLIHDRISKSTREKADLKGLGITLYHRLLIT